MSAYKIFVFSPGDVGRERHLAKQVICRVAAEFQDRVEVQRFFWEYEPMELPRDYQENIPLTSTFDLMICILWKRLGSPLRVKHPRPGRGQWRSGTEFELVTAVESKKARRVPDIFIFNNDTKATYDRTPATKVISPPPVKPAKPKRLTLDLSDDLHRRIKLACTVRGSTMVEEITKLLEKEFREP